MNGSWGCLKAAFDKSWMRSLKLLSCRVSTSRVSNNVDTVVSAQVNRSVIASLSSLMYKRIVMHQLLLQSPLLQQLGGELARIVVEIYYAPCGPCLRRALREESAESSTHHEPSNSPNQDTPRRACSSTRSNQPTDSL